MDEIYLPAFSGGKWGISRLVEGSWIQLVQDSHLDNPADAEAILRALSIPTITANLDLYFPVQGERGRCPTLELLELCNVLDPTNPVIKNKKEHGV